MATIPDFPFPTDDNGEGDNGTEVNLEWTEDLEASLVAVVYGEDNPGIPAAVIVDEVVDARNGEASLDDYIQSVIFGTDNPGVSAADIIDEVVEARDDNPDLNDRLDNFVADEIPDADTDTRGLLSDGTTEQNITGDKVFEDDITVEGVLSVKAGTATAETAAVGGRIETDITPRTTSGTTETTLSTYAMPANTLGRNGQTLVINASGKFPANANNKRLGLTFGATQLMLSPNLATNDAGYTIEARITRITASTQIARVWVKVGTTLSVNAASAAAGGTEYFAYWDTLAEDLTGPVTILTSAIAATAGTLTQGVFTVSLEG